MMSSYFLVSDIDYILKHCVYSVKSDRMSRSLLYTLFNHCAVYIYSIGECDTLVWNSAHLPPCLTATQDIVFITYNPVERLEDIISLYSVLIPTVGDIKKYTLSDTHRLSYLKYWVKQLPLNRPQGPKFSPMAHTLHLPVALKKKLFEGYQSNSAAQSTRLVKFEDPSMNIPASPTPFIAHKPVIECVSRDVVTYLNRGNIIMPNPTLLLTSLIQFTHRTRETVSTHILDLFPEDQIFLIASVDKLLSLWPNPIRYKYAVLQYPDAIIPMSIFCKHLYQIVFHYITRYFHNPQRVAKIRSILEIANEKYTPTTYQQFASIVNITRMEDIDPTTLFQRAPPCVRRILAKRKTDNNERYQLSRIVLELSLYTQMTPEFLTYRLLENLKDQRKKECIEETKANMQLSLRTIRSCTSYRRGQSVGVLCPYDGDTSKCLQYRHLSPNRKFRQHTISVAQIWSFTTPRHSHSHA